MRLEECIDKYINDNLPYLKERTVFTYQKLKTRYIKIFGNADINEFTQDFLQNYINDCQKNGDKKTTLQNRLSLLLSAIKPYKNLSTFKYIRVNADGEEKKVYQQSDINKIEEHIINHPKLSYIPILIAIHTGMRISEICGLKWEDINFTDRIISVKRNATKINGKEVISIPKTQKSVRDIYISDKLYAYLIRYENEKNIYVCSGKKEIKAPRSCQRANELLCAKLGVKNCGMHAYRHAFATGLLKKSTDFKSISEVMGHANIAITQNIYNHTTQERKNEVIKKAFCEESEQKQEIKQIQQTDYQPQINALQAQINELRTIVARMTQYVKDNIYAGIQQTEKPKKEKKGTPKYKTIDSYGNEKIFYNKKDLLQDLDILPETLTKHINGYETVLDDLGVFVKILHNA